MAYQRCTHCVMDNRSDTTIAFDGEGRCNYCRDVEKRLPETYFPNEEGRRRLETLIAQMKEDCKNDPYDCLVGVSGGIDSSYILYLGHRYGLRMLAVHIDDGLDNPVARENLRKLTEKTGTELICVEPDRAEYADVLRAFLKASVPGLAIAQDNLIMKALQDYGAKHNIRYSLDGSNFAHESILERGDGGVNACDARYIRSVHKRFGTIPLRKTKFMTLTERYIRRHVRENMRHVRPLNDIPYDLEQAIAELEAFCGFQYYGGKHYESVLTRFMQCWYLPEKFGIDKRKSHYSSLIMSGQMTRDEALEKLEQPLYQSEELLRQDKAFLADYIGVSMEEFEAMVAQPPKTERMYPHSCLNELAPIARKFRKFLE
ncbi:MAG: N-acetyl sugar amidotransferase [Ruminococcaceae bacterium]|nr:N-acetyl sugar amidotransferase [Oscillospiraceae bacterium]